METEIGVRFLHAWRQYSVGQVIFPPGMLRSQLLDQGFVELVKAPEPEARIAKAVKRARDLLA